MKRFDRQIDLHPAEYRREWQKEPFWGPNVGALKWAAFYLIGGLVLFPVVKVIVTVLVEAVWPL